MNSSSQQHCPSPPPPEDQGAGPQKISVWKITVSAAAVLVLLFLCATAIWLWSYAFSPGPVGRQDRIQVYIPPGTGFKQIKKILIESGAVTADIRFALLARIMGSAHRLKAGEYIFKPGMTPYEILQELEQGKGVFRALTLVEGVNIYQAAGTIEQNGWGKSQEFLELVQNPEFIQELGLSVDTLEGYLFPDTYFFEKGTSLSDIISLMVKRTREVFSQECQGASDQHNNDQDCRLAGAGPDAALPAEQGKGKNLNPHQIITLASIVEKETGQDQERPLVAKVFINRLQKGMKLQADPTVTYGLGNFGQPLSRKDLRAPSPYNTYTQHGLPPGPISNPGRASIKSSVIGTGG